MIATMPKVLPAVTAPPILFAADVHWCAPHAPKEKAANAGKAAPTGIFGRFLGALREQARAGPAPTLYILGDLFDFWHEHGGRTFSFYDAHLEALSATVQSGVRVNLIYGNRDFGYRKALQRATGVRVLGDRAELRLGPRRALLQHGDLLCTRDWRYQLYRRVIRSLPARALMGLVSLRRAARIAQGMMRTSEAEVNRKGERVTRIVDAAVAAEHGRGFDLVICGHVHRLQRRAVAGAPPGAELITLGAWENGAGSYVEFDGEQLTLKRFPA